MASKKDSRKLMHGPARLQKGKTPKVDRSKEDTAEDFYTEPGMPPLPPGTVFPSPEALLSTARAVAPKKENDTLVQGAQSHPGHETAAAATAKPPAGGGELVEGGPTEETGGKTSSEENVSRASGEDQLPLPDYGQTSQPIALDALESADAPKDDTSKAMSEALETTSHDSPEKPLKMMEEGGGVGLQGKVSDLADEGAYEHERAAESLSIASDMEAVQANLAQVALTGSRTAEEVKELRVVIHSLRAELTAVATLAQRLQMQIKRQEGVPRAISRVEELAEEQAAMSGPSADALALMMRQDADMQAAASAASGKSPSAGQLALLTQKGKEPVIMKRKA